MRTVRPDSWAVAVHRRDVPGELELAEAVLRCLRGQGHEAEIVADGDPKGLQAGRLLLSPNVSNFAAYADQLRRAGSQRPIVVVWQMDPLPPAKLDADVLDGGLRAAALRRRLGLVEAVDSMPRWKRRLKGVRLRGGLYRFLSARDYRRCSASAVRQWGATDRWDWRLIRGAIECWQSLRESLREKWVDHVAVSTLQRQEFLKGEGVDAVYVPVGGCPEWGRVLDLERDVDVLFLGRVKHSRRGSVLDQLDHELEPVGIKIRRIIRDCYGASREQWLNRSKLVLNLNQYPWSPAWIRFVMASLCGAAVVSEPMIDREPFVPDVHYAAVPRDGLPERIMGLLRDSAERERLVTAARRHCQTILTLERSISTLTVMTETHPS